MDEYDEMRVAQQGDSPASCPDEFCRWVQEGDEGSNWYDSSCGMSFVFNDDGPDGNGFRFCPKCGKQLKEILWDSERDDDADSTATTETP